MQFAAAEEEAQEEEVATNDGELDTFDTKALIIPDWGFFFDSFYVWIVKAIMPDGKAYLLA